jgi:hypothetical protein
LSQKLALTRLRSKAARIQSELDTLHNILEELRKGYNPNYQDMAAKAAVVGYEEFLKGNTGGAEANDVGAHDEDDITDRELDDIDRKDLDGLLLSEALAEDDDDVEDSLCGCDTLSSPADVSIPHRRVHSRRPVRPVGDCPRPRHRLDGADWLSRARIQGGG